MQNNYHHSLRDGFINALIIIACASSALAGGAYAAGSIVKEKEKKTLTLLRMSGATGFEIIYGKIMSAMIYITMLTSPYLFFSFILTFTNDMDFLKLFGGLFMWAGFTLFYLSSGILISILFKKNASASSFFYFFLFAIHFLIYSIDDLLGFRHYYGYYTYNAKFFSSLSPIEVWYNFSITHRSQASSSYYAIKENVSIIDGVADYMVITVIYILISILLTIFASNIFEKYLRWREE
jgi:ABC-type transport system involved in multi-copper enzyme maturation permease subunit